MVREPFALEFLGLDDRMAVSESDLENALIDHLQEFLLECGKGLCFEARQKRLRWWNMHYPEWITNYLFQHIYCSCQIRIN